MNTPPSLRRAETQQLDHSSRPEGVLTSQTEYERRRLWLTAHCFALIESNRRSRRPRPAPEGFIPIDL